MYFLGLKNFIFFVGEVNEFMIFSYNGEVEGFLLGNFCYFDILCIFSNGCILKEYVQEVFFEVFERNE